jgi:hypothetical protein
VCNIADNPLTLFQLLHRVLHLNLEQRRRRGARFRWEEVTPAAGELEQFTGSPFWESIGEEEGQKKDIALGADVRGVGCSGRSLPHARATRVWFRSGPPACACSRHPRHALRASAPPPVPGQAARARASPAHTCSLAVSRAEPEPQPPPEATPRTGSPAARAFRLVAASSRLRPWPRRSGPTPDCPRACALRQELSRRREEGKEHLDRVAACG